MNDLSFLRIRSNKLEILVAPGIQNTVDHYTGCSFDPRRRIWFQFLYWWIFAFIFKIMQYTVVGVYINTIKMTFLYKFWFLLTFFRITSNLKLWKKLRFLIALHCFHEYVHPCLNIVRNQNWNRKFSLLYEYTVCTLKQTMFKAKGRIKYLDLVILIV